MINKAFNAIPRENFLPHNRASDAEWDAPIPIGYGQTNSQPTTVRMMLEWLDVKPGQKILDVGSGSGWTSALLAYLVGKKGDVIAVERIPELVKFGHDNCKRLGVQNVSFHEAGDIFGWPVGAPYDRILVSASARELPPELIEQLAPDGKLVIPVKETILVIHKNKNSLDVREYPGFAFVKLI